MTLRTARAYVNIHHRHLSAPAGAKFAIGIADRRGRLRGVAIAGRPVARFDDDGYTLEVTRVATDGARNACSALYGAVRRGARSLGYRRLLTYTLEEEVGTSLRAAGRTFERLTRGGTWSRRTRQRRSSETGVKKRWAIALALEQQPAPTASRS